MLQPVIIGCCLTGRCTLARGLQIEDRLLPNLPPKETKMSPSPAAIDRKQPARRGGIVVEMILVLVVLILVTLGIVQFGMFLANAEQVALAVRVGALEASQTPALSWQEGDSVPECVLSAIGHQLESSGIQFCQVRLEHNVHPDRLAVALRSADDGGETPTQSNLNAAPAGSYVRVTVCVPLSEVLPEQLSFLGERIYGASKTYQHSATFRYELDQP
ncbi:MAG: TadE/TadG family type IV pilus assembly protein [Pirellulaceae bacterium]